MDTPLRVLHVVVVMDRGGIETLLMNLLRHTDRKRVAMDFLVHGLKHGEYEPEIHALGATIHRVRAVRKPWDLLLWQRELYDLLTREKYDVVHCHLEQEARLVLKQAKCAGVPVRIVHAHNTHSQRPILKKLVCKAIELTTPWCATAFFGCSHMAGEWLFGKKITASEKFIFFRNAIDTQKFAFNSTLRQVMRQHFHWEDSQIVLGTVGRMFLQKNHGFMLDLLAQLPEKYRLLLIGDGPLRAELEARVNELGLASRVVFTGVRQDIPTLYNAFDVFLLPSLHEGLPVVGVEAQANGLPCLLADTITPEVQLSENLQYLPLDVDAWAKTLLSENFERKNLTHELLSPWDVYTNARTLEEIYTNLLNNLKQM